MRGIIIALCILVLFWVLPLEAGFSNCYTRVTPNSELSIVTVIGRCSWTTFGYQDNHIRIRGEMTVTLSPQKAYCAQWGYCGMSLKPPYEASTRYTSTAKFGAWEQDLVFLEETTVTDSQTTAPATNPHTTCPGCCEYSPILISERGDYALTSLDDGVTFDIDADGRPERVSWTAPDSEVAFLACDRNGNGSIDSGAELFGDAAAVNGWEALATLDGNGDGVVSSSDPEWRELLLWYDRNHDGASTPAELLPVDGSSIVAIGISYRWLGRRDAFGNVFRYAGEVTLSTGRRQAYDVYFVGY